MKLENLAISRFTVHKIFSRSKLNANPYAEPCEELVNLDDEATTILTKRINACINHKSKFFELELADTGPGSFFEIFKELPRSTKKAFLSTSQKIADKAAESHLHTSIPDGLLLVVEAKISAFDAIIVVKAEKSDAFSMAGTNLQLVKDIFLSSDKALYKLGFFLRIDRENLVSNSFRCYVYDDSFSPSKGDLASYFYNKFLGLSAEHNGKLLTNKLYRRLSAFIDEHIEIGGKFDLIRSIDRAFLDSERKILNSYDFQNFFPSELNEIYRAQVEIDFPTSFVKDNSIANSIETKRIPLAEGTTLLLKNGAPDGIITGNTSRTKDIQKLKASIDSGNEYYNFALIPTFISLEIQSNSR